MGTWLLMGTVTWCWREAAGDTHQWSFLKAPYCAACLASQIIVGAYSWASSSLPSSCLGEFDILYPSFRVSHLFTLDKLPCGRGSI